VREPSFFLRDPSNRTLPLKGTDSTVIKCVRLVKISLDVLMIRDYLRGYDRVGWQALLIGSQSV